MKRKNERNVIVNEDYFNYLTKRLDEGIDNNLFVLETVNVIREELKRHNIVKVIDLGCFNGAMLNNILSKLDETERARIRAIGLDINKKVLERGSIKYKDIIFIQGNLDLPLPLICQYHVLLLSNTSHELLTNNSNEQIVEFEKTLKRLISILQPHGKILFLDGVKPDENQNLQVTFLNNNYERFHQFIKNYEIRKINFSEKNKKIYIDLIDLSAFFSKERYLETTYWEKEAKEIYQLFSRTEIMTVFKNCDLEINKQEIQYYKKEYINSIIGDMEPKNEYIPKNIIVVAEKL